ncbi:MAG: hypothetical protein E7347_04510 [Clostridiales bacterium]|nr:hypothetical protein [Clostridiales bacterium]
MAEKILRVPVTVQKKLFKDKETGESFEYLDFRADIGGCEVKLNVPKDYKKLANHILLDKLELVK